MILVIGGTGFIGKTLMQALAAEGRPALCVSRNPDHDFLACHAPHARVLRLDDLRADPGPVLCEVTGCVYLASAGRLGDHRDTPWYEARRMLAPLMRMLHLVAEHAPRPVPLIYLSSAAVYGRRRAALLREGMEPRPVTSYGTGKAMAELAIAAAGRQTGFPTRILRPSTPVGRWQDGSSKGAVGALIEAARDGRPFPMNGDGSAVRDYFDARDLAGAILAALDCTLKGHRVWNVGAGTGTALSELVGLVEAVTGRCIAIEPRPMPRGEVTRAVLDVARIRGDLGWAPRIALDAALADLWATRREG